MASRRFAFVLVFLTLAGLCAAQDKPILTVLAGSGGNIRPGAMTPIQVMVRNGERPYDGVLMAAFTNGGRYYTEARKALELAPGARKRVTLYLPAPDRADQILVRYESTRGRTITELEEPVRPVRPGVPVFGVIGTLPRGLPENLDAFGNPLLYTRLFLEPEQIPGRHEGLEIFDVLFISPALDFPLAYSQTRSLRDWILRGGILVVDASERTEAYRRESFAELLPFLPSGAEQRKLSLFDREFVYARGEVRDGEVILESDGIPLVIRRNFGLGEVVAFTFAMDDPAFLNWSERDAFWKRTVKESHWKQVNAASTGPGVFLNQSDTAVASALMRSVVKAPSTGLRLSVVLLLTGLYALIAGPGDYFLVRRLGRPKLTWITFPLIVGAFTFVAYVGARYWIGGDWEVRHIRRTTVFPERGVALQYDLTGIFVPRGDDYLVEDSRDVMLRHVGNQMGSSDRLWLDQDTGGFVHRIPIWTHRAYVTSETIQNYPDIPVSFVGDSQVFELTVQNNTEAEIDLTDIAIGNSGWRIGNTTIAPGERRTFFRNEATSSFQFGQTTSEWYSGHIAGAQSTLTFGRELDFAEAFRRGAVVVSFRTKGPDSPLFIDGAAAHSDDSQHIIQIVTYPKKA